MTISATDMRSELVELTAERDALRPSLPADGLVLVTGCTPAPGPVAMTSTPLESDGRAAASKAARAGSIPARGTADVSKVHQSRGCARSR